MEKIIRLALDGKVSPDALVWYQGMNRWEPLSTICPKVFQADPSDLAPPWRRFGAYCVDRVLSLSLSFLAIIVFCTQNEKPDDEDCLLVISCFLLFIFLFDVLYDSVQDSSRCQGTLGKRIFRIKVTGVHGERISLRRALCRYFLRLLAGAIGIVGLLPVFCSPWRQGLHDQVAGTLVVKRRRGPVSRG